MKNESYKRTAAFEGEAERIWNAADEYISGISEQDANIRKATRAAYAINAAIKRLHSSGKHVGSTNIIKILGLRYKTYLYRALDLIDRELPDESIYGWQKVTHYPKISLVGLVLPHGAQKLRGAARTREALKLVRESGRVGRFLQKQLAHMCGISKVAIAHQFKSNSGLRAEFLNLQRLLLANFRSRSSGEWTQTTPEQFTATVSRIYAADPSHKVTFEELAHELSGHEKNTPLCDLKYAELSKLYNGLKSSKSDLLNAIAEKLSNT